MSTLPQRLRQMADHTGLDAVAEMLRQAATELELEMASRKAAQEENERLKARIARAEIEKLVRDAERYRWIRQQDAETLLELAEHTTYSLDAAVDAAMGK